MLRQTYTPANTENTETRRRRKKKRKKMKRRRKKRKRRRRKRRRTTSSNTGWWVDLDLVMKINLPMILVAFMRVRLTKRTVANVSILV